MYKECQAMPIGKRRLIPILLEVGTVRGACAKGREARLVISDWTEEDRMPRKLKDRN